MAFMAGKISLNTRYTVAWPWLVVVLAITVLIYLPGLSGPFLFDDPQNIVGPIEAWLNGRTVWQEVVFGNRSGPLGRVISMASFAGNAAISGLDPWSFKVTNLLIHLLCGVLIFTLLSLLLQRDPLMGRRAKLWALFVAAIWLLHPINVSTVLYVVQRMAQLSTLFMLLALICYVYGRLCLLAGQKKTGLVWLFFALPACAMASILSKENGVLVPLLCLVVELGYFRVSSQEARPSSVKWFFSVFLFAPAIIFIIYCGLNPGYLSGGYQGRLFTLGERLLSEMRALMEYVGVLLLPRPPALGVYTDDFSISRGLFDPASTLAAIAAIFVILVIAVRVRLRLPALFVGISFFFAGHMLESTIFPLELYFEHRNYLPSIGIFLTIAALAAYGMQYFDGQAGALRMLVIGFFMFLAVLAFSTFSQAIIWRSLSAIAEQGARQHPQSMRAQLDYAHELEKAGLHDDARAIFRYMTTMDSQAARHVGVINGAALECVVDGRVKPVFIDRMRLISGEKLQLAELLAFEGLGNVLHQRSCKGLDTITLAGVIRDVADAAPQPQYLTQIWRSRFVASRLFLAGGDAMEAQRQADLAWRTGVADPAVGLFLSNMYFLNGDVEAAAQVLSDVRHDLRSWDVRNSVIADELQEIIGN